MRNIIGIKCKDKFYITEYNQNNSSPYNSVEELIINGEKPVTTFHEHWCMTDKEPTTVQELISQPYTNHRFELIDKSMESDKIKLILKREEATNYNQEEYYWEWKKEYAMYESLYKAVSDKQFDLLVDIKFEYSTILEITEIKEYNEFIYDVQKTKWTQDGLKKLTEKAIEHQMLDKIIFPNILLPSRPCSLTSKQSFDIVRQYVKQNINYRVADITSDYDFCFTVKKKIPLSESEKYQVDVNDSWTGRKRKPRYETRYRKFRQAECFNMAPEIYQGYKIIDGFRGNNQEDLKNNIDDYCKNLIDFINEPVVDCPHCKGRGVMLNEQFKEKTK